MAANQGDAGEGDYDDDDRREVYVVLLIVNSWWKEMTLKVVNWLLPAGDGGSCLFCQPNVFSESNSRRPYIHIQRPHRAHTNVSGLRRLEFGER